MYKRSCIAVLFLAVVTLLGCGQEAQEREAFIQFLNKYIVQKKDPNRVPIPTKKMRESFGKYAEHYDIIVDYVQPVVKITNEHVKIVNSNMNNSLGNLAERRQRIAQAREKTESLEQELEALFANAEKRFAALDQPDDLKKVFTEAYEFVVRQRAAELKEAMPFYKETCEKSEKLLDFLEANKKKIVQKGPIMEVKDPATLKQINALSNDVLSSAAKLNKIIHFGQDAYSDD